MKKPVNVFLIFCVTVITALVLYYAYMGIKYYSILKNENDEWLEKEFKPLLINGIVKRFEDYDGKNEFHTIDIQNGNKLLTYGIYSCDKNEALRKFIKVGDSIKKESDSIKIKLIHKNKVEGFFDMAFCN